MKALLENWNNFLLEREDSYHIIVDVVSETNTQLYGSIFNKIRAYPGVTIVKATEAVRTNENGDKVSRLDIKFIADPNAARSSGYLEKLRQSIKTMKDDDGNRVLAANLVELPKKSEPTS